MYKYPRTKHIEGSRLQTGDEDLAQVAWADYQNEYVVFEEKIDGANAGISFSSSGQLQLQSRGHYLTGGGREKHFSLFKTWGASCAPSLYDILGTRYVMYGEWVYAKHTVFYDLLPHYFLEFDIFDTQDECFLDTERRLNMLSGSGVVSVPVLASGKGSALKSPHNYVKKSLYKSDQWQQKLAAQAQSLQLDTERTQRETDASDQAEGIYIKIEQNGMVKERLKWVRYSFLSTVVQSDSHWLNRPIVPNVLAPNIDIFGK